MKNENKNIQTYYLIANTPVHPGGAEQISIIDLPIQRERHTNFPKIEASSLKGTLRTYYPEEPIDNNEKKQNNSSNNEKQNTDLRTFLFGGESDKEDSAANIGITDARILFFPVKSLKNIFAWVTCPSVLYRYLRDTNDPEFPVGEFKPNTVPGNTPLFVNDGKNTIILEEYTFKVSEDEKATKLAQHFADIFFPPKKKKYWNEKFKTDIVILNDDDFEAFVTTATEVITRIKIDAETKTVDTDIGGLFYEEYLPEDTIMYFLVTPIPVPKHKMSEKDILCLFDKHKPSIIQVGANATLGKGYMELVRKTVKKKKGDKNGN